MVDSNYLLKGCCPMKVIIIGGVAAGMSAAAKLKRVNKEVDIVVYEKTEHVSFGACGLPYFVGNFFEDADRMLARSVEAFKSSGIEVYPRHEVLNVDEKQKVVTIKNLVTEEVFMDTYDKLMIATGASAIYPPIENSQLNNVFTLKSMEDGHRLKAAMQDDSKKSIAIIGAGFIGLEVVEAAHQYHKKVSIFEINTRILNETFDKEITDILEEELISQDVTLYLGQKVEALIGENKVSGVRTGSQILEADIVVLTAGVRPNTAFLESTNIKRLKNGAIIVNEYGETSLKDVYAAGDCATVKHFLKDEPAYIPLATVANKLGRVVGENLGGNSQTFDMALASSCLKVLDLEAGRTGLSEQEASLQNINYKTVFVNDMNQTNYYPNQQKISVKLLYEADTHIILGGQIVGKRDAVQRVNVLATAIYARLTTQQLALMDFCYAPPFSRTWDVLNIVGNVAK